MDLSSFNVVVLHLARIKVNSFDGGFFVPRGAFSGTIEAEALQVKRWVKPKVSFYRELTSGNPCRISSQTQLETQHVLYVELRWEDTFSSSSVVHTGLDSRAGTTARRLIELGVALDSAAAQRMLACRCMEGRRCF